LLGFCHHAFLAGTCRKCILKHDHLRLRYGGSLQSPQADVTKDMAPFLMKPEEIWSLGGGTLDGCMKAFQSLGFIGFDFSDPWTVLALEEAVTASITSSEAEVTVDGRRHLRSVDGRAIPKNSGCNIIISLPQCIGGCHKSLIDDGGRWNWTRGWRGHISHE
jgi:hypothetical protein